jgi:hypothetical protein
LDFTNGEQRPVSWQEAVDAGEVAVAAPSIAVPTNLKQTFECPAEHLSQFIEDVGQVDRLLTIGWRAAESHALEILGDGIKAGVQLGVCDTSEEGAAEIVTQLGLAARRCKQPVAFAGGFTGLVTGDALGAWLDRPAPY